MQPYTSVLGWYDEKLAQVTDLVTPTLWLIGAFVVLMAYIAYRSWKKAAIAGIGMAIVIAIVSNVTALSDMVEGEIAASIVRAPYSGGTELRA